MRGGKRMIEIPDELIKKVMDVARAEKKMGRSYRHYFFTEIGTETMQIDEAKAVQIILEKIVYDEGWRLGLILGWQVEEEKKERISKNEKN